MNGPQYCQYCGSAQEPGLNFCENCGSRMITPESAPPATPSPVLQAPPPAQTYPQQIPADRKQSRLPWLIPLFGVACLGLLCIGILVFGGYFYLQNQSASTEVVAGPIEPDATQTPAIVPEPTTTSVPEPTVTAEVETPLTETPILPTEPPPTEPVQPPPVGGTGSVQETYTRWPMDYSLQWELGENDIFVTDINQDQSWIIGLKKPENIVMVIPPDPSAYYPSSVNISVKVKPGDFATAGPYGVMCNFQDENNYYVAEIWGDSFGIGKMEAGIFTPLTEPYWQTSQFIDQISPDGFVEIGVSCFFYSVGLEINGLGETFPVYDEGESFTGGAVALFGASSQEPVDMMMGIYYFKDLVIEPME